MMLQGAAERGLTRDVSGEADATGVETGGNADGSALGFREEGGDGEVLGQDFFTASVDDTGGRADFGVGERSDIFLQEIDEAAFALEEREDEDGGSVDALGRLGGWGRRRRGRGGAGPGDLLREVWLPEAFPSQGQAGTKRNG